MCFNNYAIKYELIYLFQKSKGFPSEPDKVLSATMLDGLHVLI